MVIYSLRKLGLIFHGLERGKYGDKCETDQHVEDKIQLIK